MNTLDAFSNGFDLNEPLINKGHVERFDRGSRYNNRKYVSGISIKHLPGTIYTKI